MKEGLTRATSLRAKDPIKPMQLVSGMLVIPRFCKHQPLGDLIPFLDFIREDRTTLLIPRSEALIFTMIENRNAVMVAVRLSMSAEIIQHTSLQGRRSRLSKPTQKSSTVDPKLPSFYI